MKKISVIVPVYNTEKYVEKCLESIKSQTMQDFEIIIVNDGSKDNSINIIKSFADKNNNLDIKILEKDNGGLSDARNYGIKYASGKYLCFIDSDDYIDSSLFEKLDSHINENVDMIKYKFIKINENKKELERSAGPIFDKIDGPEAFVGLCSNDNYLEVAWLYLYNREFWNENKFMFPKGRNHEDFALTPLILVQARTVVSTDVYGYFYVCRENSITTDANIEKKTKRIEDLIYHYDKMINVIEKIKLSQNIKQTMYAYYTNTIISRLKDIPKIERKKFIKEIKSRHMLKNIKICNLKTFVKKVLLEIDINKYLKIKYNK